MHIRIEKYLGNVRKGSRYMIALLLIGVMVVGCRKDVPKERLTGYYGKSYTEVFEAFWNGMNSNYVFWDIETVNWDNMYKTYKPRFEYLDQEKKDPKSAQRAIQYLVDMTKDLSDSHLEISFNGVASYVDSNYPVHGTNFHPASFRHQLRGDRFRIPAKVFEEIIPKHYLTNAKVGTDLGSFRINTGIIPRNNKELLYVHFTS